MSYALISILLQFISILEHTRHNVSDRVLGYTVIFISQIYKQSALTYSSHNSFHIDNGCDFN